MIAQLLVLVVLPALLLAAALWDLTSFTIPNALCAALTGLFLVFALAVPLGLSSLGWHLVAGLAGLVLGFTLFALGCGSYNLRRESVDSGSQTQK